MKRVKALFHINQIQCGLPILAIVKSERVCGAVVSAVLDQVLVMLKTVAVSI